jgi:biotin carboxylase
MAEEKKEIGRHVPRPLRVLQLSGQSGVMDSITQLKGHGLEVFVADLYPETPGFALADGHAVIDLCDIRSVTEYARSIRADAILAVNDFGVISAACASKRLGLRGLSPRVAIRSRDKGLMRDRWKQAGLPQPRYFVTHSEEEVRSAAEAIGYPLILKPAMNCGSRGVSLVSGPKELAWAIRFAEANLRNPRFLVEEYISGTEMTIEGLVRDGVPTVLAWSDKERQPHPKFQVAMSLNYPARFDPWQLDLARKVVQDAVVALGIRCGAFHCECMVNERGVFLIEMGARPGGQKIFSEVVAAASGIEMPWALARLLLGEPVDLNPRWERGVCYRFFSPPVETYLGVHNLEEARRMPGVIDLQIYAKVGKKFGGIVESDDQRAGHVVSTGTSRQTALNHAVRAIEALRFVEPTEVPQAKAG